MCELLISFIELDRGVKRDNGVFIIPLFLLKHFRYKLFLLKNFHYSIIPPRKAHIIPVFQEQNYHYSYFIIPLQPPKLEKQFILLNIFMKLRNKTTEDTKREKQTVSHAIWIECSFEMCQDTAQGEKSAWKTGIAN